MKKKLKKIDKIDKNILSANELLKNSGFDNVSVSNMTTFFWNGNEISNNEKDRIMQVSLFNLDNYHSLEDFLKMHIDKKIVLYLPKVRKNYKKLSDLEEDIVFYVYDTIKVIVAFVYN